VLKNGEIVEAGSHAELLQLKGEYSKLHSLQFKDASDGTEAEQLQATVTA